MFFIWLPEKAQDIKTNVIKVITIEYHLLYDHEMMYKIAERYAAFGEIFFFRL